MSSDVTPIRPEPEDLRSAEQKDLDDVSRDVAAALQDSLPDDCSFALFIYRPNGSTKYISSGSAEDVDAIITRWRAAVFKRPEPVPDQPGRPTPGDRRYSKYFRRNIELVSYTDDRHWTFHVDGAPAGSFLPNQSPWSKMPPAKNDVDDKRSRGV